jgi:hypothetical protein
MYSFTTELLIISSDGRLQVLQPISAKHSSSSSPRLIIVFYLATNQNKNDKLGIYTEQIILFQMNIYIYIYI